MANYNLLLKSRMQESHKEMWTITRNGDVKVEALRPGQYPPKFKLVMTPLQALRQYALLTSDKGGFLVGESDNKWHAFVEGVMLPTEKEAEEEPELEGRSNGLPTGNENYHDGHEV